MKLFRLSRSKEAKRRAQVRAFVEILKRAKITLCHDRFFRSIFGRKESEVFLVPFINAVQASANEPAVVSVTIRNPFQPSLFWEQKESVLDVLAEDETGRLFDIEMQLCNHINFRERVLHYLASVYSRQAKVGKNYEALRPVVGIILIDFDVWPKDIRTMLEKQGKRDAGVNFDTFKMTSVNNGLIFSEHIVIHFIRIPKKGEDASGYFRDPKLANWFKAFRSENPIDDPEMDEAEKTTPGLKEMRKMMISFLSSGLGKNYLTGLRRESSWGDLRFNQGLEKGWEQGLEKGWEQGLEKGWEQGMEKGETKGAYNSLVNILQNRFDDVPSEIEPVLKEKDLSELGRLQGIACKCTSYEEFVNLAKTGETPKL